MKKFAFVLVALILIGAQAAWAGVAAVVSIEGAKQGKFKGDGITAGKTAGKIGVVGYNHSVLSPRDAASGLPTGKRMHKPLVLIKEVSPSSPQIFQALVNNENLKSVLIEFLATNPNGEMYVSYTVTLTNANVASVHQFLTAEGKLMEEVTLTYQKITVESKDGKTIATDDWEARV